MRALLAGIALALCVLACRPAAAQPPAGTAAPAKSPQRYISNKRELDIPFAVSPGAGVENQAARVDVYISWDRGKTWKLYEQVAPTAGKFRFRPLQDAEFSFVTQTISARGKVLSGEPKQAQLNLIIDTQKPQLAVTAVVTPSNQIEISWNAADLYLQPDSLKIEYQDALGGEQPWQSATITPQRNIVNRGQLIGKLTLNPKDTSGRLNLRAEIRDLAGNKAYFTQQISLPSADKLATGEPRAITPLRVDASAQSWQGDSADEIASRTHDTGEKPAEELKPSSDRQISRSLAPSASARPVVRSKDPPPGEQETLPPPREEVLPRPLAKAGAGGDRHAPADNIGPIPERRDEPDARPSPPGVDNSIPAGDQPRLSSARRFSLEYDLDSVAPDGVAAVELWETTDGGKSWKKLGTDPDRISPLDVEVKGEGNFGFRIVVVGKNGLEDHRPQAGDPADIWVTVDTTKPTGRITSAAYGSGDRAGQLDIRWEASDAHLGQRPITLSYSDRPGGKYTIIAAGLPNNGQYFWQFDPSSPRQIYLRLEVRDDAGNLAVDQLTDPINVEGLTPKGRIKRLVPADESSGAFRSPLFR